MSDSNIQLLPDSLANQIAAGEVVQRPASVVKELLENAVDAKATRILLRIEEAGKTRILIQDNGSGMGFHDARMCFERHATSKIRSTDDLFCIKTLGFRGEALASIAAVAQVELKTRQPSLQTGSVVVIEGGKIQKHEPTSTTVGSILSVRNLFFNVPARRNFLKSNTTELRQIITEFQRVALSYPAIHFVLEVDNQQTMDYFPTTLAGRICQSYPWIQEADLLPVSEEMQAVTISGYVGVPAVARKNRGEQFLFVNGRFIKDYSLHHAIVAAYRQTLPAESVPVYVLNLLIDPAKIDINIHPTKSEIKFEDERLIYNIVNSAVRKAIGQTLLLPDITDNQLKAALEQSQRQIDSQPEDITIGSLYSPNRAKTPAFSASLLDKLYKPMAEVPERPTFFSRSSEFVFTALHTPFWLVRQSESLLLLNAEAARERVWYERYLRAFADGQIASQRLLYPQRLLLSPEQHVCLSETASELAKAGFELLPYDESSWIITALPVGLAFNQAENQLLLMLDQVAIPDSESRKEQIALRLCRVLQPEALSLEQVSNLWEELMRCQEQHISPLGEVVQKKISLKDIQSWF